LGLLLVAGCGVGGDGGGGAAMSSQTLAGKIGGQVWKFGTGETMAALSTSEQLWVDLYAGRFESCVALGAPDNADMVTMMMPRAPGSYDLGNNLKTLYTSRSGANYVATSGRLVIDSVTATTITGGMNITYNGENTVNGQFQATICPP
jgi:hypothetical protein